ncbi:hypothetical protein B566_EDAN011862 [Ephemera danica]|nr:hypothetical protein B566_EDAN011862 [Ephemera danica]
MLQRWQNGDRASWLLGDAGYAQEPWLMKPFDRPRAGSREEEYNSRHKRGRSAIERTIGLDADIDDADLNIPVLEDEEAEDLDDNNFAALGRQARARLVASMQMP